MSSRIVGNDRLGLGSSKIEVLANNSKKNKGKTGFPLALPVPSPARFVMAGALPGAIKVLKGETQTITCCSTSAENRTEAK